MEKQDLKDYLKKYCLGYEYRITIDNLTNHFNASNREIRKLMYELKLDGFPIVADTTSYGYFVPRKNNDLDFEYLMRYYYSQYSRAQHIFMGLKCFNQFFPKGQIEFMDKYKTVEKDINKFLEKIKKWCDYAE